MNRLMGHSVAYMDIRCSRRKTEDERNYLVRNGQWPCLILIYNCKQTQILVNRASKSTFLKRSKKVSTPRRHSVQIVPHGNVHLGYFPRLPLSAFVFEYVGV